jgi:hypothetical protein
MIPERSEPLSGLAGIREGTPPRCVARNAQGTILWVLLGAWHD